MIFYNPVTDDGKRKKFAAGLTVDGFSSEKLTCNICGREWSRSRLLEPEAKFSIALTKEHFPDFLGVSEHKLVSEKVKEILELEQITGYSLGDIEIVPRDEISSEDLKLFKNWGVKISEIPNNPPKYYRLFVKRSGELHPKTGVALLESCSSCGYKRYGIKGKEGLGLITDEPLYINLDKWNGDDMFMVKELGASIFMTEKFYKVYQKHNLTGLYFGRTAIGL